jgi:two-component system, cell cycle sensor histidine kinase and response regulator CckA
LNTTSSPLTLLDVVKRTPTLLWTVDRSLRVTSVTIPTMPGMDWHGLVGLPLTELFRSPDSGESTLEAHRRVLQGQPSRFEFTIGGMEWVGRAEPLRGPAEEIVGVTAVAFDNTDRAIAERSLRLSEQSYRSLIEEAPFAICRATASGKLLQVNRAMAEMLRYESEPELLLCGMTTEVFAKPALYDEFVSRLRSAGAVHDFESTWRCQDGRTITVSLAGRATRNHVGQISYLEILAENITERKHLEHQLRQAQKMQAVGQLAGGIAHDFNNLLTVINGQLQIALSEILPSDPLRNRLEEVEMAADRAAKLTRQLLAFGRIQTFEEKVVDLNVVVAGMTQMLTRLIGKNVDLKFTPSADLGHVKADPVQMEQVVMNLVLNAKDATPAGGSLTIDLQNVRVDSFPRNLARGDAHRSDSHRTDSHRSDSPVAPPGDYVSLSVTDTGQGISAETLPRIFEPFFTTKKPGEGTGLGLATVYGIVKQSKGYIVAESEIGAGARFTVYLPRVAAPTGKDVQASPLAMEGGSEMILLAEDEESIRKFASAFLTGLGYRVLSAADGIEAIELANAHKEEIDLLVTDVIMPRLGGRELAEDLRRTFPKLKILFMSGFAGDAGVQCAIKRLNAQLLQKPFSSMPEFAKAIRETLDQHQPA